MQQTYQTDIKYIKKKHIILIFQERKIKLMGKYEKSHVEVAMTI